LPLLTKSISKRFMPKIKTDHLFIFSCAVLIFGLLWSRFMISLGMIFLLVTALFSPEVKQRISSFFRNKYYLAVTGIFFIFLVSGLWTSNLDYFIQRMTIKLPFFFLPFAFYIIPPLKDKSKLSVFYIFIAVCFTGILYSCGLFLSNPEHYVKIYSQGQIIPTPVHHIRFSIMISIAVSMCIYLILRKEILAYKFERTILIALCILFVGYLHFLAVRSGLMTLYVMLAFTVFYLIRNRVNKLIGLGILLGTIALISFSILFVPTIKNKINYMRYSLEQFAKNENIRDLSDSRRLGSIYGGIQLAKEHPFLGVGYGDLKDETNAYLGKNYPQLKDLDLLPHNQYILVLATAGIIGLVLFLISTILPFFYLNARSDFFFMSVNLMFISSFLVEHTIEAQIGTAIYIFIVLFSMKNLEMTSE